MKDELLAFLRIRDLLAPLPPFDWPLLWPQLIIGLGLVGVGLLRKRLRVWAVSVGVSLLLITLARFAGVLYLGSRAILLLWLISSILVLVWIIRLPRPVAAETKEEQPPLFIPKKRRHG